MQSADPVLQTQEWIEKAVIGLNLCPFANAVYVKKQIRYSLSSAFTVEQLLQDLFFELKFLDSCTSDATDTTLLIHPKVLNDFLDFNDFLDIADQALKDLHLDQIIQIASFHPEYQFAGTAVDDISNFTNRSPYPTLHLLREESISKAIDTYAGVEDIPDNNIKTMTKLGMAGWNKLGIPNGGRK